MSKCPSREMLQSDIDSGMLWCDIASKYGYSDARFLRKKASQWGIHKRQFLKPTKEELQRMISENKNPYQIAEELGYSSGGWSNIYKYCREYDIEVDFSLNKDIHDTPFTQRQKEIIYGAALGDSAFRKTGGSVPSYSITFCHGEKQKDYLLWKYKEFENFVTTKDFYKNTVEFHGNAPTYSFSTVSHPFLTSFRNVCFKSGSKDISEEWLDLLTPLSLAVWYLDDGSINKSTHTIVLCTNRYSYDGHLLINSYFKEKYGIDAKLEPRRNGQYVTRINASQSKLFLDIVAPHVPKCMEYKLLR